MKTLEPIDLASVTGGVGPASRCNRTQFDWMAAHMVPDGSTRPGVQRHVVVNDARSCGFPMRK